MNINRRRTAQLMCAVLTTLAETGAAHQGTMYAALMNETDLQGFTLVLHLLEARGWVELGAGPECVVDITPAGRVKAEQIEELIRRSRV